MLTTRQRPEAFAWSPPGVEFKFYKHLPKFHGAVVAEYAQYFDPNATDCQSRLGLITVDDIFSKSQNTTLRSTPCEYRFNELAWMPMVSSSHSSGVIFGGTENGTVVFFDADSFIHGGAISVISSRRDHHGHVLSVDYSVDNRWAISAGGAAQLLVWDLTNLSTPFTPGSPNFTDQVKRVRWNRAVDNIVVSLSSHRGSVWDMRRPGGPILEFAESGLYYQNEVEVNDSPCVTHNGPPDPDRVQASLAVPKGFASGVLKSLDSKSLLTVILGFGSGCDWADICWKPGDSSTLIIGSQSALTPGIQKWDLRYATAAVNEFHLHDRGVTAMDWHRKDTRIVVSAGNDGFVRVFNPDTGELHGSLQLRQNDKVRAITWSEVSPDLLAIQYFQHPTEFRSIEPGCEGSILGRLNVGVIPAWVSAAPVGASFALGGKMAAHYRQWDDGTQSWNYIIEIKMLPFDKEIHESAMELQNACDSRLLGAYCEDRAHGTNDRNLQTLWTFLAAMSNKQSRREFLHILGYGGKGLTSKEPCVSRTSATSNEITQLTNTMSSLSYPSPSQNGHIGRSASDDDDLGNDELFSQQSDLDYTQLDENAWSLFDAIINEGNQAVVDRLIAQKDYATAFMLAREQRNLLDRITERYIAEQLSAPQRLLSLISTANFDKLIETFPCEQRCRLFALVLSSCDRDRMIYYMRKMALKWSADKGSSMLDAALAAILAQDVELLLHANQSYSLDERIKQAIILQTATGATVDEQYETLLCKYCEKLIAGGVSDVAWRLLSDFKTENKRLLSLRHSLYFICGGEERTMSKEPANPHGVHAQAIANAVSFSLHQQQNPVHCLSATPVSSSLVTAVYNQTRSTSQQREITPIPPIASNPSSSLHSDVMTNYPINYTPSTPRPMYGYQPTTSGLIHSDPLAGLGFNPVPAPILSPPVAELSSFVSTGQCPNVPNNYSPGSHACYTAFTSSSSINNCSYSSKNRPMSALPSNAGDSGDVQASTSAWNDPPSLPGRKASKLTGQVLEVSWKPLEQATVSTTSVHYGLPGIATGIPQRPPSTTSQYDRAHHEISHASLSFEDRSIIEHLNQLIDNIVRLNQTATTLHKAGEAKMRLGCELAPRLAAGKLLLQCCELSSRGDYRGATATCRQMVQAGGDFVEVSSFVPTLKSLFSLAQSTFMK